MLEFNELFLLRLLWLIPFILSLSVHEWAHAMAATLLGDDTAKCQGRLTLNPIVHVDPLGSFVLPMLGFPLAWAKPVPFNPVNFTNKFSLKICSFIVAAAGPISNIVIALICYFSLNIITVASPDSAAIPLLATVLFLNVALAIFNMLPFPPLDGSYLVKAIVPTRWKMFWKYYPYIGPALLFALIFFPMFGFPSLLLPIFSTLYEILPYSDAISFS